MEHREKKTPPERATRKASWEKLDITSPLVGFCIIGALNLIQIVVLVLYLASL